jgi:phage host-nuclease inhibitor protein Gam
MTANELADELTKMFRGEEYDRLVHEIPDLLRQQAKEIVELKKIVEGIIGQAFYEDDYHKAKAEIEALKNARDYWCLAYKDVFNKLETLKNDSK